MCNFKSNILHTLHLFSDGQRDFDIDYSNNYARDNDKQGDKPYVVDAVDLIQFSSLLRVHPEVADSSNCQGHPP